MSLQETQIEMSEGLAFIKVQCHIFLKGCILFHVHQRLLFLQLPPPPPPGVAHQGPTRFKVLQTSFVFTVCCI